jgi:hypothetical protein
MEWTEEKEKEIATMIDSDLKCQSLYKHTLMAIERREMNECWGLDPIREGFYKLCKPV